MEIIISGEDKERLKQVEDLAKRLGLKVEHLHTKEKLNKENKSVDWPHEERKVRVLPGRENADKINTPIKLKVALKDLPHKCTRTILVPEDIDMRQLHFVIQESFDWLNAHLFQFTDGKAKQTISVGMPDDFEMDWAGPEKKDAHEVKLKKTFLEDNAAKAFWYNYDFGDDWWHQISFLKLTKKDREIFQGVPVCIQAQGKRPPEDIGGPFGYTEFLEVIKNEKHPEFKETRIWYGLEKGEKYNETEVDLEDINFFLDEFYHSQDWTDTSYELF